MRTLRLLYYHPWIDCYHSLVRVRHRDLNNSKLTKNEYLPTSGLAAIKGVESSCNEVRERTEPIRCIIFLVCKYSRKSIPLLSLAPSEKWRARGEVGGVGPPGLADCLFWPPRSSITYRPSCHFSTTFKYNSIYLLLSNIKISSLKNVRHLATRVVAETDPLSDPV